MRIPEHIAPLVRNIALKLDREIADLVFSKYPGASGDAFLLEAKRISAQVDIKVFHNQLPLVSPKVCNSEEK